MPATSEKQKAHLDRLNNLSQTISNRFKKGQNAWNKKRENKKDLCPICKINLKGVYYPFCKKCSYEKRSKRTYLRIWKSGYVYVECGSRPRPLHITIAEKVLGRELKKGELVHHINLIKGDNRNENLLICDWSYHKWLHNQYAREFVRRFLCPQQSQKTKEK